MHQILTELQLHYLILFVFPLLASNEMFIKKRISLKFKLLLELFTILLQTIYFM